MRRSALMNGASVVLEFLPKEVTLAHSKPATIKVELRADATAGAAAEGSASSAAKSDLVRGNARFALEPIVSIADFTSPNSLADDLAAARFPQALGHLLAKFMDTGAAEPADVYCAALCLATLVHNQAGFAMINLIDDDGLDHPAVLALRGYLAFQCRHEEMGRKSLARAALLARSNPAHRNILHFTQNVLLAQQFGG